MKEIISTPPPPINCSKSTKKEIKPNLFLNSTFCRKFSRYIHTNCNLDIGDILSYHKQNYIHM